MANLEDLLLGRNEFARDEAPEPSLLPHLARMAHASDVGLLVDVTFEQGLHGGSAPPWYALWEAVIDTLVADPAGDRIPQPTWDLTELELRVRASALRGYVYREVEALVDEVQGSEQPHLVARLANMLTPDAVRQLVDTTDPGALPAESARALLAAANWLEVPVGSSWLDALVEGGGVMEHASSRTAHVLPELPAERQAVLVDELGSGVDDSMHFWFEALLVSRIAPAASGRWPARERPKVWNDLIDHLLATPLLAVPHADVLRAHPFASELMSVTGRHETASESTHMVGRRWARLLLAGPPDTSADDVEMSPPSFADDTSDEPAPEMVGAEGDEPAAATAPPAAAAAPSLPPPAAAAPPAAAPSPPPPPPPSPDGSRRGRRTRSSRARSDTVASGAEPAGPERRLQADVFAGSTQVERAFIAGTSHEVQVSIGHRATIQAVTGFNEPVFEPEVDRMPLIVRFLAAGVVQELTIQLQRDQSRDSTVASFAFEVASDEEEASAFVGIFHHDQPAQLIQGAVLIGPVVPDVATERSATTAIELKVEALVRNVFKAAPSTVDASLVAAGDGMLASDGATHLSIDRSVMAEEVQKLSAAIQAAADLITLDAAQVEPLLRNLAIHGRAFHSRIASRLPPAFHQATHLQVVAADPQDVLPLEFVYDGPAPTDQSVLCENWKAAVLAGSCDGCPGGGPDADGGDHPRVCPNRFWGLSKVIERHAKLVRTAGGFDVRSERAEGRERLGKFKGSVVGASDLVSDAAVRATVSTSRSTFGRTASQADTWTEWRGRIKKRPSVLVAMPHHAMDDRIDPPIGALELGGELLRSGAITPEHIRASIERVGPVVMLVGCHTGADRTPFDSFAGDFRSQGASVVIATVGEIIADHAAEAAQVLIRELGVQQKRSGTIGEAVQMMRRKLLADGNVLGLLIITHGDADWQLGD